MVEAYHPKHYKGIQHFIMSIGFKNMPVLVKTLRNTRFQPIPKGTFGSSSLPCELNAQQWQTDRLFWASAVMLTQAEESEEAVGKTGQLVGTLCSLSQ